MAICGVISPKATPGLILQALGGPVSYCQASDDHAAFGAASQLRTVSTHRDTQILVTCDAEIFNQKELATQFAHPAASPAFMIAALYRNHGEKLFEKLDGVFAFAIWDKQHRKLIMARDRLGIKSLCYAQIDEGFVFASNTQLALKTGLIDTHLNHRALVDYLNFNVVPAPQTAYKRISKLQPGEYLIWQAQVTRVKLYWTLRYSEDLAGSERTVACKLFEELNAAVCRTTADLNPQNTGCFLSGGTDSSSIAGIFRRIIKDPVPAFSVGFHEERFDELHFARLAAQHFDLQHFTHVLRADEVYDLIPKIVDMFDEPFANSSAIPAYACVAMAKDRGISTMLAGDGGDEIFGGNERYRIHQVYDAYQRVPKLLRSVLEPCLFALSLDNGIVGKAKRYIRHSNTPNPDRYCRWRLLEVFGSEEVLGEAMPQVNGNSLQVVRDHLKTASATSDLNRLMYVDTKMTLGDEDLPKVVRTAEALGVKVRFPYLDPSLVEFAARLPVRWKVNGFEKRYLFKRATRNLLPLEILRKKKHGFGLPIGLWLKTDPRLRSMLRDVLLSPVACQRGYFRRPFVENLMSRLDRDDTPYYGDLLWVFLTLELWHRRHVGARN